MTVLEILTHLGGVASRAQLEARASRRTIEAALSTGEVIKDQRGRYALPTADASIRAAAKWAGVVSHQSAALLHGWKLKQLPTHPHVTVPPKRKIRGERTGVTLHYGLLFADDLRDGVTTAHRTLSDCLRAMPFDEALCVADSALRAGATSPSNLVALAASSRGPGARNFKLVAGLADPRSSGPFESVLRAICFTVPGLRVEPQVRIGNELEFLGQPDLVDVELRLVIEADSFEWHGKRASLRNDARRYNAFTAAGWTVLRFTWEDVMLRPAKVREVLVSIARAARSRRALLPPSACPAPLPAQRWNEQE